jgi:hypothetical protein
MVFATDAVYDLVGQSLCICAAVFEVQVAYSRRGQPAPTSSRIPNANMLSTNQEMKLIIAEHTNIEMCSTKRRDELLSKYAFSRAAMKPTKGTTRAHTAKKSGRWRPSPKTALKPTTKPVTRAVTEPQQAVISTEAMTNLGGIFDDITASEISVAATRHACTAMMKPSGLDWARSIRRKYFIRAD